MKAWEIDTLPAGTRICFDGKDFIRMADAPWRRAEGCVLNLATGTWGEWSRYMLFDEDVTVITSPSYQGDTP